MLTGRALSLINLSMVTLVFFVFLWLPSANFIKMREPLTIGRVKGMKLTSLHRISVIVLRLLVSNLKDQILYTKA